MQAGKYRARAAGSGIGIAESSGNEQIGVMFRITEQGPEEGKMIVWRSTFTPETQERSIKALRACGWQGDDLTVFCDPQDIEKLLPIEVELVVEPDTYKGETRMKVKWVNSIGAGSIFKATLDAAGAKAFAARMKGACKVVPVVKAPVPTNGKPMRQPGEDMEDDFPPGL